LEIQIRLALPEDASAIASVLSESFAEYKAFYTPQGFTATTPANEGVLSRINEGPVCIASLDQIIVGTVAAVPVDKALYLRGMAIIPAARGRTIGEMLLRQVESFAFCAWLQAFVAEHHPLFSLAPSGSTSILVSGQTTMTPTIRSGRRFSQWSSPWMMLKSGGLFPDLTVEFKNAGREYTNSIAARKGGETLMKTFMSLLLSVALTLAVATVIFAQDAKRDNKTEQERKGKNKKGGSSHEYQGECQGGA
jgi:predicted N-acetyltransferase YhbS